MLAAAPRPPGARERLDSDGARQNVDRSAYWFPTLYAGDRAVRPSSVGVYYATGYRQAQSITAFPESLRMITGDAKGVAPVGDEPVPGHRGN
jgi:Domain of unknown function (DUF1996)